MPSYSELRCSDADRERVVSFLREQHSVGRLDHEELDERIGKGYAAKTIGDLERLMIDLPRPGHPQRPQRPVQYARPRPPQRRPHGPSPLVPLGIVACVFVGGPVVIGIAVALVVMAAALVFAAGVALGPFILVALLIIGMLRRGGRRRPHFRPHY